MTRKMRAVDIIRESRRIDTDTNLGMKVTMWCGRIISGIAQGLGLLALIQLATGWSTGKSAGGLDTTGWLWVLLGVAVLGAVSIFFRDLSSYQSAFAVMRSAHRLIGDQLAKLPLGWFATGVVGKLSRLGASTVNELGNLTAHMTTSISVSVVTLLTLLTGFILWYPQLGLLFAICLVGYAVVMWALTFLNAATSAYKEPAAVELSNRIVEFASCQPVLRSCDRISYPQLDGAIAANRQRSLRALWLDVVANLLGGMAAQIICVLMIVLAAGQVLSGQLNPLEFIAVIGISLQLVQYLTAVADARVGLLETGPTMATIGEVLDSQPLPEPEKSLTLSQPQQVELRDVNFSYQDSRQILGRVSFSIPPRTMTALVGPSGSGKTTIARLICRFWDVDSGSVRVGGVDVRQLTTADLMSQISMVFQDVYLFNDTLAANVSIGNPQASVEEVKQAAELAGVSEIVNRLPDGWDTQVGEGGTALSGGERQRVSVARAILKKAPIVLFDEASSALDAENEANLIPAFNVLRQQATVLVIAHKLHTITQADQIVVLNEHGQISQIGSHKDLIGTAGVYRDFWENRNLAVGWKISPKLNKAVRPKS